MPKIMLIDDSKAVTYIVKKFLETEGYEVRVANNAYRGLDVLRKETCDLIISDIMMPGMDGFELGDVIKKDEALKGIPLIFFTAKGDISDEFHGYMTGAEYYITKPVKKRDLLDKIEKALGLKSTSDETGVSLKRDSLNKAGGGGSRKAGRKSGDPEDAFGAELSEPDLGLDVEGDMAKGPTAPSKSNLGEIINIYGSMIEVMWAFSFDKLLTFDNLNVIETAIDKTCLDFPFMAHMAFSEDGIDLTRFKEKVKTQPIEDVNQGFTALIANFFDLIIHMANGPAATAHTVYLVGDDAPLIADLEAALNIDGYTVKVAEAGDKVAEQAAQAQAQLVIVALQQIQEPEQKLCRDVRAQVNSAVPVILVSNSQDRKARKLGYEAGADEVMSLPWSKLTLLRMIRKTLNS